MKRSRLSIFAFLVLCLLALSNLTLAQSDGRDRSVVSPAMHHDVSPPLRNIRPNVAPMAPMDVSTFPARPIGPQRIAPFREDPVLQSSTTATAAFIPFLNLLGLGEGFSGPQGTFQVVGAPPDPNGAVGDTQYVQWVNLSFAIFDKATGAVIYGPAFGNTLWSGFGGPCETTNNGDPIAQYDKIANRWVMTQFAISEGPPYFQCVAVSTTSDATGAYYRYAFEQPDFPDYPKLGVWPDGYYLSFNMFQGLTGPFAGGRACAFDREAMLIGAPATQQCFQLSDVYGNLLPSDLDGKILPPAGSPNYFIAFGTDSLEIWNFHVDWTVPANSTFNGPLTLPVAPFSPACGAVNQSHGTCVPQYGTNQLLDSLGDRMMYRLAYRNFGDHEAIVANHSVAAGASVGVRWYELRDLASGAPTVYQQGTYAPDAHYRWMGSIAMDGAGNIALGYSVSNNTLLPAIRYTGREAMDPLGTLQAENSIFVSVAPQIGSNRWGDYSAMAVDPVDDCTFWYTNEYLSGAFFAWSTRIASFRFPSCGPLDFSLRASPASQTIAKGETATYTIDVVPSGGFNGAVALSVAGLPRRATGTFSPNPTTDASTLTLMTVKGTRRGSYPLTITGTSGALTRTVQVTLIVQ